MENHPIDSIEEFKTSATTANTSPGSEGTRKNMSGRLYGSVLISFGESN